MEDRTASPAPSRRTRRRWIALALVVALLVAIRALAPVAMAGWAEKQLAAKIGVPVHIGNIDLFLLNRRVRVENIVVGNAESKGHERLARIGSIDLALGGGGVRSLLVDSVDLDFHRDADGARNWAPAIAALSAQREAKNAADSDKPKAENKPRSSKDNRARGVLSHLTLRNVRATFANDRPGKYRGAVRLVQSELSVRNLAMGDAPTTTTCAIRIKGCEIADSPGGEFAPLLVVPDAEIEILQGPSSRALARLIATGPFARLETDQRGIGGTRRARKIVQRVLASDDKPEADEKDAQGETADDEPWFARSSDDKAKDGESKPFVWPQRIEITSGTLVLAAWTGEIREAQTFAPIDASFTRADAMGMMAVNVDAHTPEGGLLKATLAGTSIAGDSPARFLAFDVHTERFPRHPWTWSDLDLTDEGRRVPRVERALLDSRLTLLWKGTSIVAQGRVQYRDVRISPDRRGIVDRLRGGDPAAEIREMLVHGTDETIPVEYNYSTNAPPANPFLLQINLAERYQRARIAALKNARNTGS